MTDKINSFLDAHRKYWPETYNAQLLPLRILLFHAQLAQHSRATEIFSANGLSLAEFDVLASLRRSPPPYALTPSDIRRSMLITSGGLTKVLIELEKRGLVSRTTKDNDRRIKPVALTDQALPVLNKVMKELDEVINNWINQSLTSSEIDQLSLLLAKITK